MNDNLAIITVRKTSAFFLSDNNGYLDIDTENDLRK